jgi:hypothetical protein
MCQANNTIVGEYPLVFQTYAQPSFSVHRDLVLRDPCRRSAGGRIHPPRANGLPDHNATFDLRNIRIRDYAKRGIDISNAMPPGGQGLNKKDPEVIKLMDQQKQMIVSMGQFLGEEVLHVMRGMEYARTIMATLTNGTARSGYIPNDAACGINTFEAVSSRLKPGCAETSIVNGILDLMAESRSHD